VGFESYAMVLSKRAQDAGSIVTFLHACSMYLCWYVLVFFWFMLVSIDVEHGFFRGVSNDFTHAVPCILDPFFWQFPEQNIYVFTYTVCSNIFYSDTLKNNAQKASLDLI
jgi:hypothetical protein